MGREVVNEEIVKKWEKERETERILTNENQKKKAITDEQEKEIFQV